MKREQPSSTAYLRYLLLKRYPLTPLTAWMRVIISCSVHSDCQGDKTPGRSPDCGSSRHLSVQSRIKAVDLVTGAPRSLLQSASPPNPSFGGPALTLDSSVQPTGVMTKINCESRRVWQNLLAVSHTPRISMFCVYCVYQVVDLPVQEVHPSIETTH